MYLPCQLDIGSCIGKDVLLLVWIRLPDDLSRHADHYRIRWDILPLGYNGASTDDGSATNLCTVEDDCPHADQDPVVDRAAMQDCAVTDGYITTYRDRKTFAGMDYTIILDIGPIPDDNPVLIGTDDSAKPYPNMISDSNITRDCSIPAIKSSVPEIELSIRIIP